MKRNPYYLLRQIRGCSYLLPYGQSIARQYRGMQVNETGILLWELLAEDLSFEELLSRFAAHVEAEPDDLPALREDLHSFLNVMTQSGALVHSFPDWMPTAPLYGYFRIAGLLLRMEGSSEAYHSSFEDFREEIPEGSDMPADMTISVTFGTFHHLCGGASLLTSDLLSVTDCGDFYDLEFHENRMVKELLLKKDAKSALFYCEPPYDSTFREELFHGIREAFLYLAALHDMVALHSSSILYKGRAFLFSGRSGTGKSTHAQLWKSEFGTPYINGDLNLIGWRDDSPVVHGIPWCGTSGIYSTESYPLGGITLLKQAASDHVEALTPDKQILLVDQRLISHSWTPELFDKNLSCMERIAENVMICRMHCTKFPSAVHTMKAEIDRHY